MINSKKIMHPSSKDGHTVPVPPFQTLWQACKAGPDKASVIRVENAAHRIVTLMPTAKNTAAHLQLEELRKSSLVQEFTEAVAALPLTIQELIGSASDPLVLAFRLSAATMY